MHDWMAKMFAAHDVAFARPKLPGQRADRRGSLQKLQWSPRTRLGLSPNCRSFDPHSSG
jgi:hypothetical protein